MEIAPVSLTTRYQYLEQYAIGGQVRARKELPWKLMILGAAALVLVYSIWKDSVPDKPEAITRVPSNNNIEE